MTDRRITPGVEPEIAAMVVVLGVPEEGWPLSLPSSPPALTLLGNRGVGTEPWEEGYEATFLRGSVCDV